MMTLDPKALLAVRKKLSAYLRDELGLDDHVIRNLYARPMYIAIETYLEHMQKNGR